MVSASVKDVAALAGVSVGTVSNVLNRPEKVSAEVTSRVQSAIDKLGFVRNDAARQLRAGMSHSVGLVVLDAANPFFTDLARGAEDRAATEHFTVLVGNSSEDAGREAAYLDLFEQQRVRGVLISPVGNVIARLEQLRRRGIPTVLVDRQTDNLSFSSVAVDDLAGGEMAVAHLLSLGRRRIAFVGGPESIRQVADRLSGARKAMKSVPDATLEVFATESLTVLSGRSAGEAIRFRPLAERPDAIFAANDLLAVGVLQGLMLMGGVQVPREIALIGYDDIDFAAAAVVPLSSIRQPSAMIGSTALELLLREAAPDPGFVPQQIVFPPELVVRASTLS
ncbi:MULTISPECIES: LacI family DNA-binding transcriptional regulator [unclassified Arthrobacter]|uniref:LacI family DNA-binding transcriptional regulator n=1 Tax=unclassified Arthrobacter TaxID=235627 RepID=UPI002E00DF7D|nr:MULTISPECIES: LacI family DNA-binding transcriptional regulator [unclassified Arthrobacter]MEC5190836.1 LacI family transcriptional regulator [Arthrobacter sp. MP_M4]MEC5202146.1 LacI family transcriptional regulator [Arthrobacter sp. MP_M7]